MWKPGLLFLLGGAVAPDNATPSSGPCATATAHARLAPATESGPPLVVHGQVYRPDGSTPASGVFVYAYQTGRDGLYGPPGRQEPRLRAWVKTAADGTFRLDTIRPASYPNSRIPAHIHFQAWGPATPHQYTEDLLFADDPFVDAPTRARSQSLGLFSFVQPATDGAVRVRLRLKPTADRMEASILHGFRACSSR
jgi:protocatechuate 3,4-dioxygenase beta subunit